MGEIIMFPGVKDNEDDAISSAALARGYKLWRKMNKKKYDEYRASVDEALDDEGNIGSILVTGMSDGTLMVQCDISSEEAIGHLTVAISLLEKKEE